MIPYLLHKVREDAEGEEEGIAAGMIKFGTAIALATCASLRGSEVFLLDLAGLWKYFKLGENGVLPVEPMRKGADLTIPTSFSTQTFTPAHAPGRVAPSKDRTFRRASCTPR